MKLIPAICPSCGARLNVDSSAKKVKCEFCDTNVFIDDGVQRVSVEISNIPKLNNYIKIGLMHYKGGEYDESYVEFSKALELDPDNFAIILRKGLSKSLASNYYNFDIKPAENAFNNAVKILKKSNADKETINSVITETKIVIDKLNRMLRKHYDTNGLTSSDVREYTSKLLACLSAYESIIYATEQHSSERDMVINDTIPFIDYICTPKRYKSSGSYTVKNIDPSIRNNVLGLRSRLLGLRTPAVIEKEQVINNQIKKRNKGVICIIVSCLLFLFGFAYLTFNAVCFVLFVIAGLLFIPYISDKLMQKVHIPHAIVILLRIVLVSAAFLSVGAFYQPIYSGTYIDNDNNMKIVIDKSHITMNYKEETNNFTISKSEYNDKAYYLSTNSGLYQFVYDKINKSFCIINNKQNVEYSKNTIDRMLEECDYKLTKENN